MGRAGGCREKYDKSKQTVLESLDKYFNDFNMQEKLYLLIGICTLMLVFNVVIWIALLHRVYRSDVYIKNKKTKMVMLLCAGENMVFSDEILAVINKVKERDDKSPLETVEHMEVHKMECPAKGNSH